LLVCIYAADCQTTEVIAHTAGGRDQPNSWGNPEMQYLNT